MRVNSRALQSTMNTDCGLPIPMHRPFITLDAQYDKPLPFRRRLKQVTELTAENSTPYQLPKERSLSALERLPPSDEVQFYSSRDTLQKCTTNPADFEKGLLCTSRMLRRESLDMLLGSITLCFEYPLNKKDMFRNHWCRQPKKFIIRHSLQSPTIDRSRLSTSTFEFMRRIRLEKLYNDYPIEGLLEWQKRRKWSRGYMVFVAGSVRFIEENCPLLTSLHIELHPGYGNSHDQRMQMRGLAPLTKALVEFAEHCPSLKVIGFITQVLTVCFGKTGSFAEISKHIGRGPAMRDLNRESISVPLDVLECSGMGWALQDLNLEAYQYPTTWSRRCY